MAKIYSMRSFQVTPDLTIHCQCEGTSYGFRHTARILRGGWLTPDKMVKCCYYNRTWESFEFESVLEALAQAKNSLTDDERTAIRNIKR